MSQISGLSSYAKFLLGSETRPYLLGGGFANKSSEFHTEAPKGKDIGGIVMEKESRLSAAYVISDRQVVFEVKTQKMEDRVDFAKIVIDNDFDFDVHTGIYACTKNPYAKKLRSSLMSPLQTC